MNNARRVAEARAAPAAAGRASARARHAQVTLCADLQAMEPKRAYPQLAAIIERGEPPWLASARVSRLLRAVTGLGQIGAEDLLATIDAGWLDQLSDLDADQRMMLARLLRARGRRAICRPGSPADAPRMTALSLNSQHVRSQAAAIKRHIAALDRRSGALLLSGLLAAGDQRIAAARACLLIASVRGFGPHRVALITQAAGVTGERIRDLTDPQRAQLARGVLELAGVHELEMALNMTGSEPA